MWLLIPFVAVPMIEIALFISVGGAIGLAWTLLIVLTTAVIGANLVRSEGAKELGKLRQSFSSLSDPSESLASGAMILFASAAILYDTSKIMLHYRTDQHVGAALELFASVALLLWYVIQFLMSLDRR